MSIRTRLALGYSAAMIVTLVIVGGIVWWQMGLALRASLEETLGTRAIAVVAALENDGQSGLQEPDRAAPGVFAAIFSSAGSLLDASADAPANLRPGEGTIELAGRRYLIHAERTSTGLTVLTGASLAPVDAANAALARLLLGVGLAAGAASTFGGWWLAGRAFRPVDAIINEATTLGGADLDRRLPEPTRLDEIGRLARTLNGMLDRIDESVRRQRTFVAMASHELRTPLAAMRIELEIADHPGAAVAELRRAVRAAQADAIRLSNLATGLLELAAVADDGRTIVRAPIRPNDLLATTLRGVEPLARQRDVQLHWSAPADVVSADRTRLEQALVNLVVNAVAYSPVGGEVEVRGALEGSPGSQTFVVEVLDRGPGIGDDAPELLFEPFRRGSHASGSGSGLGLATAASAIRAHRGSIGAANREGGGARFWFRIPCERPDPSLLDDARP